MAERQAEFEQTVMPHLDAVYRMARRLAGRSADAEDLVQETYLKAYRGFKHFELRDYGARPWLFKILHNVFYSRLDKGRRQPSLLDDGGLENLQAESSMACEAIGGDGQIKWDLFDEELKSAIDELAPEYREILLLWALEEMSYKEIAEIVDCPMGTVMSRLFRARKQLGQRLSDYAEQRGIVDERSD